jgi:hypothetical protein
MANNQSSNEPLTVDSLLQILASFKDNVLMLMSNKMAVIQNRLEALEMDGSTPLNITTSSLKVFDPGKIVVIIITC